MNEDKELIGLCEKLQMEVWAPHLEEWRRRGKSVSLIPFDPINDPSDKRWHDKAEIHKKSCKKCISLGMPEEDIFDHGIKL